MADTQSFAGKVIVITGGARNIGRALALEMAAAGAAVCVTSRAARVIRSAGSVRNKAVAWR